MRLFRESRISRASLRGKMLPHECVGIFIEKFHKFVTKEYHDDEFENTLTEEEKHWPKRKEEITERFAIPVHLLKSYKNHDVHLDVDTFFQVKKWVKSYLPHYFAGSEYKKLSESDQAALLAEAEKELNLILNRLLD